MRRVTLGRVAGVFGVRGWVKIVSYTRPAENLLDYSGWWLMHQGQEIKSKLVEGRAQGQGIVAQIEGQNGQPITDRDVAARLIGAEIQVDRAALPELKEGEYYWADLVGLKVANEDGAELGQVESLTSNGAQDVLVLKGEDGVERMIPFVRGPIVKSVDLQQGLIVADWQLDY